MKLWRLSLITLLPAAAIVLPALRGGKVMASSHAEAPAIADDPTMDNTDVWAWQDSNTTVCILTGWNGLSSAAGGPNYRKWTTKENGNYEIYIDTNGDGIEDITYQFNFTNVLQRGQSFLRMTSPGAGYGGVATAGDAGGAVQNQRQTYTVSRLVGPRRAPTAATVQVTNGVVAPSNTGFLLTKGRAQATYPGTQGGLAAGTARNPTPTAPLANPQPQPGDPTKYEAAYVGNTTTPAADGALMATAEGGHTFVGPRQDAFFIDLGPTFDQLSIRTVGQAVPTGGPDPADVGEYGGAFNLVAGHNVEVIAIQIPISTLGLGATPPLGTTIGVWSASSRRKVRVIPASGGNAQTNGELDGGKLVQVSRLGNPLVNELFIPYDQKDAWNADEPKNDKDHWGAHFLTCEVATIENALYGVSVPGTPRKDLLALFAPDTLKVRVDLNTTNFPGLNSGLGGLRPDDLAFMQLPAGSPFHGNPRPGMNVIPAPAGGIFPISVLLGRTIADDVTDIYLKAAAGLTAGFKDGSGNTLGGVTFFAAGSAFPNATLGDGCDFTDPGDPGLSRPRGAEGGAAGIRYSLGFPYMGTPYDGQEVNNSWPQSPRHP